MLSLAIGDIHGSYEKLVDLVERCRNFAADRPRRFIFLGDYVDRGKDTKRVVDYLIHLQCHEESTVFLAGNHEQMLLNALSFPEAELTWYANGGEFTLNSYKVARPLEMPKYHLEWLRSLKLAFDDGMRLFVHAGVDPSKTLEKQDPKHLLWIREPFLSSDVEFGRLVVHGHTPTETRTPELRPNRLNLDTGAVYGGPLSAAVFTDLDRMPVAFLKSDLG